MDSLSSAFAAIGVSLVALYLLFLGGVAVARPEVARRFLGGFARSPRAHFVELGIRTLGGAALVLAAPRMAATPAILIFGWVLIGTSLALAFIPWHLHRRFAAWSVPRASFHLPLIGIASIAGGLALFAALLLPRAAG
jgi:hypothetical protein